MSDTWQAAFERKVAERQAEADAVSAADRRDDAAVFAEIVASMSADVQPWFRQWVRDRLGSDRVPTRAEIWVLLEMIPTEDSDEDPDEDALT
jgi:hypothetical protein